MYETIESDDLFYIIPLLCYVPFIFSRPFDVLTIPIFLFIAIALALTGLIIHFIRYKPKLKIGKMFLGLAAMGISLVVGGIFVDDNEYRLVQFFMMLFIAISLLVLYTLLISSTRKLSFDNVCDIINGLAFIILLQEIIYYIINPAHLATKKINFGWGISNNIALMLLLTIPFSFHKSATRLNNSKFAFLTFTAAQYIGIILTFSRGCIFFGFIECIILIIIHYGKFLGQLKRYFTVIIGTFIFFVLFVAITCLFIKDYYLYVIKLIFNSVDFMSLNGRSVIYTRYLNESMNYPIFGHGVYYPFISSNYKGYLWGHCTLIHSLFTTGILGTLLLCFHLVEKYYSLIKNMNLMKTTIFMGLLMSGLYGMIDISYFYINYMIVLIILLVIIDPYIERMINIKKLEKYVS